MLLMGIALGLALGLLVGGRLSALVNVPLRFAALLFAAIVLRYGTQILIAQGSDIAEMLRVPLYAAAFGTLIAGLWLNRRHPGLIVVMVGVASNALAILINGGWMPVYGPAIGAAGLSMAELSPTYHVLLPTELGTDFLRMAGPLGDVIPFPSPILPNVVSLGDILMTIGLGWFVFATLLWGDRDPQPGGVSLWTGTPGGEQAPVPRRVGERPVVLGGGVGPGLAPPPEPPSAAPTTSVGPAAPSWHARVRTHPYVRLARDSRFAAFWLGQTISVFGDRVNQMALAALVLVETESALLSGLVFVAAMVPNLLLSPIAGTFVDRWNHKWVMVVSDLLRAGLVLLIPLAAAIDLWLVYPIILAITTVSLFFRPARAAVLPRIVREDDLLSANGAMWTGDTLADIAGYPLAAVLVTFLGANLALAFWLDAATYVVSGVILAGLVIPPVVRTLAPRVGGMMSTFTAELRDGWKYLRGSPPLFQNTLISTVGQLSLGATLALTPFFALDLLGHPAAVDGVIPGQSETLGALEAAIGVGNLVGGFAVGAIGTHLRKGRLVVGGFVLMGIATVALGLSGSTALAMVAAMGVGVFNLVWLIPSQTLFGELVPGELMGRVVAIRGSLVFGAMTASAALCSMSAELVPTGVIFALMGVVTIAAGLVGALLPAVRDV